MRSWASPPARLPSASAARAGREVLLVAGDIAVIPAGVAHFNVQEDGPLLVVGAYPGSTPFDTLRGEPAEYEAAASRAAAVPVPDRGPVPGRDTLRRLWSTPAA